MLAAVCALGASLAWGVGDFLGGLKSRTVPLLVVLLLAQVSGVLAIGLVVAIAGNPPPGASILWAPLAATFGTIGLAAFFRGMAVGSISVVAPIAAVAAGVPWALAAVIGFGGYYVPMHEASGEDFLWAAFTFRISVLMLVLTAWLVFRPPLGAARGSLVAIAMIGVMDTAGNSFFAAASSLGEVSVVSVLATLYPVVTVGLAAVVLSERVAGLQLLGVVAALAGLVLISAGS